jgi:hypothetical protein
MHWFRDAFDHHLKGRKDKHYDGILTPNIYPSCIETTLVIYDNPLIPNSLNTSHSMDIKHVIMASLTFANV